MSRLIVCTNLRPFAGEPSCVLRGSKDLLKLLEKTIAERGLNIDVKSSVCLGHCPIGPNIRVAGGKFLHEATEQKLLELLDRLEEQSQ
ncbi:MAG TPA: hypothetical protein DCM54_07575 [Gammaproteobacteria bacterium]|nr:hypothetical protein [Gammaproteobacteria bacterium]